MSVFQELVDVWRAHSIPLASPATAHEIVSLELLLGATLPDDAVTFYRTVNGTDDWDHHHVSWWPLSRVLTERYCRHGDDERGSFEDTAFGDFLAASWHLWFRRRGKVISIIAEGAADEIPSFTALVARYLSTPESLSVG